ESTTGNGNIRLANGNISTEHTIHCASKVNRPVSGQRKRPVSHGPKPYCESERVPPLTGLVRQVHRRTPLPVSVDGMPAHHVGEPECGANILRPRLRGRLVVAPRLDRARDI